MAIAEKIKIKRKEKKLTQKKLGELCGIAETQIQMYEYGKINPKLSTLKVIANALDEDIFYFLDIDSENEFDTVLDFLFGVNPPSIDNLARSLGLNKKEFMKLAVKQNIELFMAYIEGREPKILNKELAKTFTIKSTAKRVSTI